VVEIDMGELKTDFLQEAKEYIELLNQNFIRLEGGDSDALDEIFRVAHTLKGMAGFMGYKNLEDLCHKLESLLGEIREGRIQVSEDLVDLLLLGVDKISEIVESIEGHDSDSVEINDLLSKFEAFISLKSEDTQKCLDRQDSEKIEGSYNTIVEVTLSDDCIMKNVRVALVIESLSEISNVIKVEPDGEEIEKESFDGFFRVYLEGETDKIKSVMEKISEIKSFKILEVDEDNLYEDQIESLDDPSGTKRLEEKKGEMDSNIGKINSSKKNLETIRVKSEQIDKIMNLVGELVINKGRLLQISQEYDIPELMESVNILEKSITSLQDEVMRIRMVKIERIFNKFPRMVRDLSRKLGKKIEFVVEGQDTELDRTVLDQINDSLVHLVRNAVDHGIEFPEERIKAGKPEVGLIRLSAKREKSNVVIEIEDDGKGLDPDLIKKKALERGLVDPSEIEKMSDEDIKMLIFMPGFSTKNSATEISGRGVGMDVVKTTAEKLGGNVRIYSKKGEGTKIRINLPPTVAIIKSLIVRVGGEDYAIPLSNVIEALYIGEKNLKYIHGNPFLYVRGSVIPVLSLRNLFNIDREINGNRVGVIIERENEKFGLIVDEITNQQEIVIKPLTSFLSRVKGFLGVTILGDGRVIPILDVSALIGGDICA
jgi:two-component system chemotaxis sensor kinase CheA